MMRIKRESRNSEEGGIMSLNLFKGTAKGSHIRRRMEEMGGKRDLKKTSSRKSGLK